MGLFLRRVRTPVGLCAGRRQLLSSASFLRGCAHEHAACDHNKQPQRRTGGGKRLRPQGRSDHATSTPILSPISLSPAHQGLDCDVPDVFAQLVERCRCLVDATPEAIKFTVDRVWKAADSASNGQVPQLPCAL